MSIFSAIDLLMQQANVGELTLRLHRVDGQLHVCITNDLATSSKEYHFDAKAQKANALRAEIAKSLNVNGSPAMLDQGFAQTLTHYAQSFAPATHALTALQSDLGVKSAALNTAISPNQPQAKSTPAATTQASAPNPAQAETAQAAVDAPVPAPATNTVSSIDDEDEGSL
ncbi:hypothetical protein [Motilimonas eburnea]|uniref:hypothetical protein n=1 Tax=Motilimonas eburnea TaxID=1737488 RepID=UPI001E2BFE15|nr:hypothetical protein [Motilimonas eburnea]MCE2571716.1 hypothetical protein [Motilimonas eburnea]